MGFEGISANTEKLRGIADRIDKVNNDLSNIDGYIKRLYWNVGIGDLLSILRADLITGYNRRLHSCSNYLRGTADDIETIENELRKLDPFKPVSRETYQSLLTYEGNSMRNLYDKLSGFKNLYKANSVNGICCGVSECLLSLISFDTLSALLQNEISYESESKTNKTHFSAKTKFTYEDDSFFSRDREKDGKKKKGFGIEQKKIDSKHNVNDDSWYKKKGINAEIKVEAGKEVHGFYYNPTGSSEHAEGSFHIGVGNAEYHESFSAGFYTYEKDKNGNIKKIVCPSVCAEAGGSVSLLDIGASGRIGLGEDKNMLGVYGDANITVLELEGQGELVINPKAGEYYAGLSAELNAVKIDGAIGVSVLGADIGATGSLKVGVGAHAQAGYTDGKFKLDMGVAIGVGFDVGLEVDVGGMVSAVTNAAEKATENVKSVIGKAKSYWNNLMEW